jgi:hypothetical protein
VNIKQATPSCKYRQSPRTIGMLIPPAMRHKIVDFIDERISQVHVTRHVFTELKDIVAKLGQDVGIYSCFLSAD